ncbi:hypothetical protein OB919_08060 [Halobacteria archaeon AArc-curdl1]|uniref:Uncharacterized protein n=1 Tax=Natronosalvus hydrolyticus TaxID=2979988 RepID=A0AAP2Z7A2_9EURY|nr:hypothetical protein [Halobacteria archaeon AArc-curdl1]
MGEFADDVIVRLKDRLERELPFYRWETEYRIVETPVDVGGVADDSYILVELEWRRADPADNAAKIFRHLSKSRAVEGTVTVVQLFTDYYDLASGGVSSKRKNAEFVGEVAAESLGRMSYHPLDFDIDPPKAGEERFTEWKETTDSMAATVSSMIEHP